MFVWLGRSQMRGGLFICSAGQQVVVAGRGSEALTDTGGVNMPKMAGVEL